MKKFTLYFLAIATIGIAQTPSMVKDINPGPSGIFGASAIMPVTNGVVIGAMGNIWHSDGTTAGTYTIKPVIFGGFSNFTLGGKAFFWANDGVAGYELWESDGTTAGTNLVKDV